MRFVLLLAALISLVALAFIATQAQSREPDASKFPAASDPSFALPLQSLTGRSIKIYFRGSDNIVAPEASSTEVRSRGTLDYLTGVVTQVQKDWIHLRRSPEQAQEKDAWVPVSSIAIITTDETTNTEPAAHP